VFISVGYVVETGLQSWFLFYEVYHSFAKHTHTHTQNYLDATITPNNSKTHLWNNNDISVIVIKF